MCQQKARYKREPIQLCDRRISRCQQHGSHRDLYELGDVERQQQALSRLPITFGQHPACKEKIARSRDYPSEQNSPSDTPAEHHRRH